MIDHFGFFMIRRPARSIRQLLDLHHQLHEHSLETLLRDCLVQDASWREAIMVASASLYERMDCWLRGGAVTEKAQLLNALFRYLIRTSARCTPFGLFSAAASGKISSGGSNLTIPDSDREMPKTALDVEVACALNDYFTGIPTVRRHLKLYCNSSLYEAGIKYHYIEKEKTEGHNHLFISAIEKSEILSLILDRARTGIPETALTNVLTEAGFDEEESSGFIAELVENQILEFQTGINPSGADFTGKWMTKMASMPHTEDAVRYLSAIDSVLKGHTPVPEKIARISDLLQWSRIAVPANNVLKVDTFSGSYGHRINYTVIRQITKSIEKLTVLNRHRIPPALERFRERFIQKYGDREISLPVALDDETGIGYVNHSFAGAMYAPMIDDLDLRSSEHEPAVQDNWWQQLIIEKYTQALKSGQNEIRLTDQDLDVIREQKKDNAGNSAASSFYLFGNLLSGSEEALDQGNFRFNMLACQGPSAINMLSRFSDGLEGMNGQLIECIKREEAHHPDVVFAEIIHLPEGRAGNVTSRPRLYDYEIPYLGEASVPEDFRIPIDDLMVSVRSNTIVLRSRKLNKRVVPRNSNMHNYEKGLPVYRFLCDLQYQEQGLNIAWDWGVLKKQQHLPRVCYENMILARETWLIPTEHLKNGTLTDIPDAFEAWNVPEMFVVASGDNELLIDRRIPESVKLLLEMCRKNPTIRLMEFMGTPGECVMRKGDLPFVSEVVIPMFNASAPRLSGYSVPDFELPARLFLLGSEWLYLKIYVGEKSNEQLLLGILNRAIHQLRERHVINLFFFVRYRDPEHHLRLRFKGNAAKKFYQEVLHVIHEALSPLIEAGIVHNIQTDSYCREIERYGWNAIDLCEKLFQIDSLETMNFLQAGNTDENERFAFAVRKINLILHHAGCSLFEKHTIMEQLKEGFVLEFNGDVTLRKKLNQKYQLYKYLIENAVAVEDAPLDYQQQYLLQEIVGPGTKSASYSILASLIHMSVNRLFPAKQRIYELMIYHCLFKHYDSVIARARQIA